MYYRVGSLQRPLCINLAIFSPVAWLESHALFRLYISSFCTYISVSYTKCHNDTSLCQIRFEISDNKYGYMFISFLIEVRQQWKGLYGNEVAYQNVNLLSPNVVGAKIKHLQKDNIKINRNFDWVDRKSVV